MKKYLLVFAVRPTFQENQIEAVISKIEKKVVSLGGSVVSKTRPVLKKFCTKLRKHPSIREGFFVEIEFTGPANLPNEINSLMRVSEEVIRYILVTSKDTATATSQREEQGQTIVEVNPEMLIGKSE